jgi:hypothetical protein
VCVCVCVCVHVRACACVCGCVKIVCVYTIKACAIMCVRACLCMRTKQYLQCSTAVSYESGAREVWCYPDRHQDKPPVPSQDRLPCSPWYLPKFRFSDD